MIDKTQPKKWLVAGGLGAIAFCVICFCFVLRFSWFKTEILNPKAFDVTVPKGFAFEIKGIQDNNKIELTGWDIIKGEPFLDVNNWVVLYDAANQTYTKMPTEMRLDNAATEFAGDGTNYSFGGFYSVINLTDEKMLYHELCFAVTSNDKIAARLIHTGKALQEVLQ